MQQHLTADLTGFRALLTASLWLRRDIQTDRPTCDHWAARPILVIDLGGDQTAATRLGEGERGVEAGRRSGRAADRECARTDHLTGRVTDPVVELPVRRRARGPAGDHQRAADRRAWRECLEDD